MIILRNIALRRGAKLLLSDTDLTIQPGQRLALIGANGSGKSTLFAALQGELAPDSGEIEGLGSLRIACMAQEVHASAESALDYLIGGDPEVSLLRKSLKEAELAEDYAKAGAIHAKLDDLSAYDIEHRAERLLIGLGFEQGDQYRPLNDFSGGWRIRLNLGRALMTPSELMLLDEPTNHLDLDATLWLQNWLRSYQGTLLLISHDRDFIDACCQQVLHLEHQGIESYRGNYSDFERMRAERLALQQAAFDKQQRRISEIDDFVRRFRYKATKAKQAQSRLKELERMQKIAPAHVDSPFHFRFPEPQRASDPILSLRNADLGYGDTCVLQSVSLEVHSGARVGLLGKNGAGKSTLLKSLNGHLEMLRGDRLPGTHCRIAYFDQHQLEALDLNASPLQQVQRARPGAREQEVLDFLGGFNFHGDMAKGSIEHFSGGEKARLALALTVWEKPNVLIMDEPTNHLDLDMRHALTMALQTFSGALLLVTHDRHLLANTVDELWLVHAGSVDEYKNDIAEYERWVLSRDSQDSGEQSATPSTLAPPVEEASGSKKEQRQAAAAARQRLQPLRNAVKKLETELEKCTARIEELNDALADPEIYQEDNKAKLEPLLMEQATLSKRSDELETQWLEQQEALEEATKAGEEP